MRAGPARNSRPLPLRIVTSAAYQQSRNKQHAGTQRETATVIQGFWFTVLAVFAIGVAATASWFDAGPPRVAAGGPYLAILIGLMMSAATSALQARTDYELGVPDEVSQHSERLSDARIPRAHIILGLIAIFGLAAFRATLAFTVAANRGLPFPAPRPFDLADVRLLAAGAIALVLSTAVFATGSASTRRQAVRMLTWMTSVVVPAALSAFLLLSISTVLGRTKPSATSIAAIAGVVAFLWTANSLIGNVWLLQGRRFRATDAIPAASLALLSGSTVMWVLTRGIQTEHGVPGSVEGGGGGRNRPAPGNSCKHIAGWGRLPWPAEIY